jgi:hypothetical protein
MSADTELWITRREAEQRYPAVTYDTIRHAQRANRLEEGTDMRRRGDDGDLTAPWEYRLSALVREGLIPLEGEGRAATPAGGPAEGPADGTAAAVAGRVEELERLVERLMGIIELLAAGAR